MDATGVAARAADLWKVYGTGEAQVIALRGVNVELERGQFTAIMGPSGSGKSTLMHCLAGLDSVTRGEVWIGDTEVTGLGDAGLTKLRRDKVGFIFQQFNLLPTLTAAENILAAAVHRRPQAGQAVVRHRHRHRRPARPARPPPQPALRRPAAARRLRPRPGRPPRGRLRRRAHRQPRLAAPAPRSWPSCATPYATSARPSSWSPTTPTPPATPTASSSSPTARSSTRCSDPTAEAVLDRLKRLDVLRRPPPTRRGRRDGAAARRRAVPRRRHGRDGRADRRRGSAVAGER